MVCVVLWECGCLGVGDGSTDNDLAAALESACDKAVNGNDGDNCTAVLIAFRRVRALAFSPRRA